MSMDFGKASVDSACRETAEAQPLRTDQASALKSTRSTLAGYRRGLKELDNSSCSRETYIALEAGQKAHMWGIKNPSRQDVARS